jgi:PTS system nitrogen regulatory IIA component
LPASLRSPLWLSLETNNESLIPFAPHTVYLNIIQIAESFGVSEKIVEGWIRDEGLPHTPDRGILLFDRAQVADWAASRGLAAQAGFLALERPALGSVLQLGPLLRAGGIWRDIAAAEVTDVFARVAAALPGATPPVQQMLGQRLRAKGGVSFAPIGGGFALPHPSSRITLGRDSGAVALILLRDSLPVPELRVDDVPLTRLLFLIAPSPRAHLDLVGRLSRLLSRGNLRAVLEKNPPDDEIFQAFSAADAALTGGTKPEVRA